MRILVTGGSGFIGTNLIDYFSDKNIELLNIDIKKPQLNSHIQYWTMCNILDKEHLIEQFENFQPNVVIHLAARADNEGTSLNDYRENIEGTINLLEAVKNTRTVQRIIITSTQFVYYHKNELPVNEEDFAPYTIYGESKVLTENHTRNANLNCIWTIIRPTRVWGFWQPGRLSFYKMLKKGIYIHPGRQPVKRAFGYVGNVIYQIMKIIEAEERVVNKKVFYVGDMPINLIDWVEGFSQRISDKKVIFAPRIIVRFFAYLGDILKFIGIEIPINSYRFKSLTTNDDNIPMEPTFKAFGKPPYSLKEGIEQTVELIKLYYPTNF